MKNFAQTTILLLILAGSVLTPSISAAQATWGGYIQSRFSSDYQNTTGFSIRRAKLYATGVAPFDTNISARIQAIFRTQTAGTLMLEDAYAEYRLPLIVSRVGQFVPEFGLQRLQPDAVIPVVERALVVDALIPSAETYARDIGAQVAVSPFARLRVAFGAFNGNGGNQSGNNDRQLLYVARPTLDIPILDSVQIHLGMSFAYRNKSAMTLKKIFGTTMPFSGKDIRWGGEARIASPSWSLQAEYLEAILEKEKAYGYYVLGAVFLDRTNELAGLVEQFNDLDPKTVNAAWYGAGWNHYFSENRFKTSLAVRMQHSSGGNQYAATLQLQLYIH